MDHEVLEMCAQRMLREVGDKGRQAEQEGKPAGRQVETGGNRNERRPTQFARLLGVVTGVTGVEPLLVWL